MGDRLGTNWNVLTQNRGRPAKSTEEKEARGVRLAALREVVLGVSQEKLGELAGIARTAIVKMEGGDNAATGAAIQRGLARAFGIDVPDMGAYLDGELTVSDVQVLRDRVSIVLTKDVLAAVHAEPHRWHASTLLMAAERVRHLTGNPEGGAVRFLDELERGIPDGSVEQAEEIVRDITRPTVMPGRPGRRR